MRKLAYLLICGLAFCGASSVRAQSTIFNYQGRLNMNANPASGLYDFEFTIFKVETNGLIIAGPLTNSAVAVSNGLFNVALDFGNQPFLGVNRWLDIAVRTSGSASAFTRLTPRVRIASAPYAIAAANVIDGAVTAEALSPGPGPEGQVLKMSNGVLAWSPDLNSGGGVTSVATGNGLLGGPITNSGTLSINSAIVPLLNGNQTFSGSNIFAGVSSITNSQNRFVGAFIGNGAGLTNITATSTNALVTLAGDVTGPSSASTVSRIRSINVLATAPATGQHLRFSGTDWTPSAVALGTDVSGTLADARLSANVPLLNANQTFSASNIFNGVASMTNVNNRFSGAFVGNGIGLTTLNAANLSLGTLADARLSSNVPLLNGNQTFAGSNTFNGVASLTNVNNRFVGAFIGNGAGLTNITATSTNTSVTLAGDVTGPSGASTVARIRSVNVLATAPVAGQHLRFSGTDWTPSAVALATDVSGTLADARLSANVPLLNGNQTFSASNIFNGVASMTNVNNRFNGAFVGNGIGLTTLNAANLALGTLADARLSANVPLLNVSNRFSGAFIGDGSGLTNINTTATNVNVTLGGDVTGPSGAATVARIRSVNVLATAPTAGQHLRFSGTDWTPAAVALATDVSGTLADARLSPNVPLLNGNQTFAGSNNFNGATSMTNVNNRFTGAFGGTGIGLTTLNAANLALGTIADARLSANVPLLNRNQTFSGTNIFNGVVSMFGQFWTGGGTNLNGLFVENTSINDGASALVGSAPATSGVTFGVFGQAASPDGTGVQGLAYGSTNGNSTGVYGQSISTNGTGVVGVGSAQAGVPIGVYGEADAPLGIGVYGIGAATTGVPVGVYGTVSGTNGYGLYTPNTLYVGGGGLMGALRVTGTTILSNVNNRFVGGFSGDGSGLTFTGTNSFNKVLLASGSSNSPALAFTGSPFAGLFNPGTNILGLATAGTNRVHIAADGKIGLGRTPLVNRLEVEGDASKTSSGGWAANSDARIKTDVKNLDHALSTIERVRPVSFNYTDEYRAAHPSLEDKRYYNVIAQEFARVFPDSVKESGEMLDGKPILQVDVHPAAIYAIAAIQELHGMLKAKDDDLAKLKEQNTALEKRLQTLEKVVSGLAR